MSLSHDCWVFPRKSAGILPPTNQESAGILPEPLQQQWGPGDLRGFRTNRSIQFKSGNPVEVQTGQEITETGFNRLDSTNLQSFPDIA